MNECIYIYIISHHELSLECAHGSKLWLDETYCTTTSIPIIANY